MAERRIRSELVRVQLVFLVMMCAFGFLTFTLWSIQVAHGHVYEKNLNRQSIRRVRLPGMRGRVFDRYDRVLADNRPNFCIAIYIEELRESGSWTRTIDRVDALIQELSGILQLPPEIDREDIEVHFKKRLPLPLLAWRDVGEAAQARWAEQAATMVGVDKYIEAVRIYPNGPAAAHLLGYVGRAPIDRDPEEPFHYYLPEMAGKSGLEYSQDKLMRGEAGGRLMRIDVKGFRRNDKLLDQSVRQPKIGSDLMLSIDLKAQRILEKNLEGKVGAAVLMDPNTGDILAMASFPGFDPNAFVPLILQTDWDVLQKNPDKPMFNRAVAGTYPPGSIVKPLVALGGLQSGKLGPRETFHCANIYELGGIRWHCAHNAHHGDLGVQEAIARSCNVFFYRLGYKMGYETFYHQEWALGLGQKTGIALNVERAGLLPNDAWMRQERGHGWRKGDTINAAIGHGAISVTPLQMASVVSSLASRGKVYKPRLIIGQRAPGEQVFTREPPVLVKQMNWAKPYLTTVLEGMHDAVQKPYGTGRLAKIEGLEMGGKTGTAEYGPRSAIKYRGWMIAFAPFDNPRYAMAIVLDDAESGGGDVGPIVARIFSALFFGEMKEEAKG